MTVNTAPIKYAQRSDSIYLTISVPDIKDESIELTDTSLKFTGKSNDQDYKVDIEFFKPVNAEGSTYKVLPRSVQMHIMKKEEEGKDDDDDDDDEKFWPRLLKDKALEKNQVKIDWDRYVDEDEEEEGFDVSNLEGGMGMGGMGPGGMPDMSSMMGGAGGGMGGMDMNALMAQMGQMGGGAGGLGGPPGGDDDDDDEDDSDDDDLPDLEET